MGVSVRGLTKSYGGVNAVDALSLEVESGAIFGLVGPNGAGKTTLLSMLAGLRKPTAGEISIDGLAPRDARIGFMPDTPVYYPWLTAAEVMSLASDLCGIRMPRPEVVSRLARVGLIGREDDRIGGYSRGMLQRLALATALASEAKVLLLDEPCSALDPVGRAEVLEMIAELAGRATVIFSTHLLSDVERVCDSVAMVNRGRLVMSGPIDAVRMTGAVPGWRMALETPWPELVSAIAAEAWCSAIHEGRPGYYSIEVNDFPQSRRSLMAILDTWQAPVIELSRMEPSLEDVFMRLMGPSR